MTGRDSVPQTSIPAVFITCGRCPGLLDLQGLCGNWCLTTTTCPPATSPLPNQSNPFRQWCHV